MPAPTPCVCPDTMSSHPSLPRLFLLTAVKVSEAEMRGLLAMESELSVEEILLYRSVAR